MLRIGIEFLCLNPILGSFGISSINDKSGENLAKARHSAGKELIRLIEKLISRTLDFRLQFCEKKCGLCMDVYGIIKKTSPNW